MKKCTCTSEMICVFGETTMNMSTTSSVSTPKSPDADIRDHADVASASDVPPTGIFV